MKRGRPDHDRPTHHEALRAESRQALAHALARMERSLQRLRDVERQAAPITRRLLPQHIAVVEENIAKAVAEFLRAEPDPTVLQAYRITSECAEPSQPERQE